MSSMDTWFTTLSALQIAVDRATRSARKIVLLVLSQRSLTSIPLLLMALLESAEFLQEKMTIRLSSLLV